MEKSYINKELTHKVHEHIEGRYELNSFDYVVIQSLLCDLQKFHSLNIKLNELRPTKQVIEKNGSCSLLRVC